MIGLLPKIISALPLQKVTSRLANRYTTHGSLLLGYAAVQANILPKEVLEATAGVKNFDFWLIVAIGFFLIIDKGIPALSKTVDYFVTTKQEELNNMMLETKILEEKLKQQELINKLGELENG